MKRKKDEDVFDDEYEYDYEDEEEEKKEKEGEGKEEEEEVEGSNDEPVKTQPKGGPKGPPKKTVVASVPPPKVKDVLSQLLQEVKFFSSRLSDLEAAIPQIVQNEAAKMIHQGTVEASSGKEEKKPLKQEQQNVAFFHDAKDVSFLLNGCRMYGILKSAETTAKEAEAVKVFSFCSCLMFNLVSF
jgi:hypothetical protein